MPKMKTNKSLKKRFRVTATGKLKRHKAGRRHLLSHKSARRKRHLRRPVTETDKIAKTYKALIGKA